MPRLKSRVWGWEWPKSPVGTARRHLCARGCVTRGTAFREIRKAARRMRALHQMPQPRALDRLRLAGCLRCPRRKPYHEVACWRSLHRHRACVFNSHLKKGPGKVRDLPDLSIYITHGCGKGCFRWERSGADEKHLLLGQPMQTPPCPWRLFIGL